MQDDTGLRESLIQIYNLEGDRIIEFHSTGTTYRSRFPWNGRDRDGDLTQPGYYLLRVKRISSDGKSHEEVLPLLFRNDD
jgi:hypothetical protein